MTGLVKHAAVAAVFVVAVLAIGRAIDQELATAGAPLAVSSVDTGRVVVRGVQSERGGAGADLRKATPLATSSGGIGTAATYRDGLTKEFGNGLIRVNGHGPEWHRAKRVKAERRGDDLQRRLTRRVLEVLELGQILRRYAAEKLEVAARVVAREGGDYSDWDGIQNLLAAAAACEVAWDEDHPDTEEGDTA